MIGKISTPRGEHVQPLLYYLFGPGRHEEHTDPHIVAGWRHPASLEPPLRPDGKRDFTKLAGLLLQPQAALGKRAYARPVWHCSMRAAPEDRMLSDDEWAQIAHDVMHRTGLSPYGQEDQAVRWVAVRHGDDHIHIVAMLARQDGGKPGLSWERVKVRAACLAAEQRYGLRSTAPADRTAARRPTRAENEKAARCGLDEAPRVTLRRQVATAAASANSEDEFFARLDQAGVLVRKRFSITNPGQVTGYSVALPGDTAKDGGPVWYGGGKLAADLTWPKLRQRWTPDRATPGRLRPDLTAEERNALWEHATRIAADATAQIRHLAWTNPAAAADAAWATSDTLHVAAAMLGSRILSQAADAYDRAARAPYGRIPPPSRWEPATAGRPADIRVRLHHPGPVDGPGRAHHQAGRARRSRRRTPRIPAARRPGRRRTTRRQTPPRRHPPSSRRGAPGRLTTATTSPAAQQRRAARRPVVPQASQGRPSATRTRSARPRPGKPATITAIPATTTTWPSRLDELDGRGVIELASSLGYAGRILAIPGRSTLAVTAQNTRPASRQPDPNGQVG